MATVTQTKLLTAEEFMAADLGEGSSKSRTVVIHRLDDELPVVLREDAVIENLPEFPGFRCPVSDFFV
jgi:hypothetical protein